MLNPVNEISNKNVIICFIKLNKVEASFYVKILLQMREKKVNRISTNIFSFFMILVYLKKKTQKNFLNIFL